MVPLASGSILREICSHPFVAWDCMFLTRRHFSVVGGIAVPLNYSPLQFTSDVFRGTIAFEGNHKDLVRRRRPPGPAGEAVEVCQVRKSIAEAP